MKKIIFFIILSHFFIGAFAQKQANVWYFGRNAGLDFNSGTPTALTDGQISTLEGCSTFSDKDGNLLFYSDGITVWDKNHDVMRYSTGGLANDLKGDPSSTQSGMIIPRPESTTIYYLFTVDDGIDGLNLYTIDISLNGGVGEVIAGPVDLSFGKESSWSEKVAAVRGNDCDTYWVVSPVDNEYYAFKVDKDGVNTTPVISTTTTSVTSRGNLKLSPDGTKLAVANQNGVAMLYDFNATTGVVDNASEVQLTNVADGQPYGVEFSVDSRKLYISTVSDFRGTTSDPETTYKLFQFDLFATDIPASKSMIHEQTPGFRGSLQLGPDSKIYATIPLAYDDPSGDATSLDVIENPNALARNIIFTKGAVNLGGQLSTQGLPPFISSLLLPIEIIDVSSTEVINNQDLKYCIGQSIQIQPGTVTGSGVTYEWTFDNGTTTSVVSNVPALTINNLTTSNNGTYTLVVTLTNSCGNATRLEGTFNVEVFQPAVANPAPDINFCDLDGDGFNSFDLVTDVNPTILGTQDPAQFEVFYYLNRTDAEGHIIANALTNPYTNTTAFTTEDIFARVHNKDAPFACYEITQFQLRVTGLPTPTQAVDYEACDDSVSGGDTDGFFNNFLLSSKDAEILNGLLPTQYSVSYHTTLAGAQADATTDVIDKNTPYRNTTINEQTIYVRVENVDNANCNTVSESSSATFKPFKLIVNPLPVIINNPALMRQCDTDSDLSTSVNLTQAEINISSNYVSETFTYYTSQSNANSNTNAIADPIRHTASDGDQVWVRTTTSNGCFRVSRLDVSIQFAGDVAYNREFAVCDDLLDVDGNDTAANDDTDGITNFDLSSSEDEIKALFLPSIRPNLEVLYFETIADRDAVINSIPDIANYRNSAVPAITRQPIYIKIINRVNNDCTGIGQLYILAQPVPVANPVTDIEECDDFSSGSFIDGENTGIDLRTQVPTLLGTQNPADFTVTFHTTEGDADTGSNAIPNDSNYRNTAPTGFTAGTVSQQTIYVRITNNTTSCYNSKESFDIIINPIPVITNTILPLEVCDTGAVDGDTRNGLEQQIDLSVKDTEILDGRDPVRYLISYHKTRTEATDGINAVSKTSYSNDPTTTTIVGQEGEETLWISILDTDTGCRYGATSLLIRIHPEPNILITDISNLSECDDDLDGDDTNGIIQNIDLTVKESEILTNYPVVEHDDFKISYHTSQNGAVTNTDIISDTDKMIYTNTSNPQRIYIRVENKDTGCVNDDTFFDLIINPLPDFDVTTPQIVCLNNPPITIQIENPNGSYTYEWTKDTDPAVIGNTTQLIVSTGGNYNVTATNVTTLCKRTRTIVVNESIIATITDDDIKIIDDSNNNSIVIDNANNNLGIGDYEFALQNEDGTIIRNFQDEPLFDQLQGGIYSVLVRDKNGCGIAQIDVSVIEFPKFFTPNNDGTNDIWVIKGANSTFYPESNIYIFDRFGKVITKLEIDGDGWNGLYNGKVLPSSDYWFNIQLVDRKGNVRDRRGHFSLLRK